ncbi:hypothetical protein Trydic_g3831 [Trypoxylus dichotomus]
MQRGANTGQEGSKEAVVQTPYRAAYRPRAERTRLELHQHLPERQIKARRDDVVQRSVGLVAVAARNRSAQKEETEACDPTCRGRLRVTGASKCPKIRFAHVGCIEEETR